MFNIYKNIMEERAYYYPWLTQLDLNSALRINDYYISNYFNLVGTMTLQNPGITRHGYLWNITDNLNIDRDEYNKLQEFVYILVCDEKIIRIKGNNNSLRILIDNIQVGHFIPPRLEHYNNERYTEITDNENKVIYNTVYHYLTRGSIIKLYYCPIDTLFSEFSIFGSVTSINISLMGNYEEMAIGKYMTMRGCVPQLNDIT